MVKGDLASAEKTFSDWLKKARSKKLTLLLSAEAFYGKHAELAGMTEGLDVRVVGFLRNPVDYLLGNHNQGIKRHMSTRRLSREVEWALKRPTRHLSGHPLLAWGDAFGDDNCQFMPYQSPSEGAESIERTFLRALGVSSARIEQLVEDPEITNRSYVGPALELKRLLNTVLPGLPAHLVNEVDWSLQGFSDRASHLRSFRPDDLPAEVLGKLTERFRGEMQPVVGRFPELDTIWNSSSLSGARVDQTKIQVFDLSEPLQSLENDSPQAIAEIRQQALNKRDEGLATYAFFRLLEVLNIDFAEPEYPETSLSSHAIKVLENEKSDDADYLREFALALERLGYLTDALQVIGKANTLRPKGKGIIRIKNRLKKRLGHTGDEPDKVV